MRYIFYFVCMGAAKNRRAVPATEEKIGKVLEPAIKRDFGKRKGSLWRYR